MFAGEVESIEDGLKTARRVAAHGVDQLRDVKDDAVHGVKKRPLEWVGGAFGAGVAIGIAIGWVAHRLRR